VAVDYKATATNLFVVAIRSGWAMIPLVAQQFFSSFRKSSADVDSGIVLAAIAAVLPVLRVLAQNAYFQRRGIAGGEQRKTRAAAAKAADTRD